METSPEDTNPTSPEWEYEAETVIGHIVRAREKPKSTLRKKIDSLSDEMDIERNESKQVTIEVGDVDWDETKEITVNLSTLREIVSTFDEGGEH